MECVLWHCRYISLVVCVFNCLFYSVCLYCRPTVLYWCLFGVINDNSEAEATKQCCCLSQPTFSATDCMTLTTNDVRARVCDVIDEFVCSKWQSLKSVWQISVITNNNCQGRFDSVFIYTPDLWRGVYSSSRSTPPANTPDAIEPDHNYAPSSSVKSTIPRYRPKYSSGTWLLDSRPRPRPLRSTVAIGHAHWARN